MGERPASWAAGPPLDAPGRPSGPAPPPSGAWRQPLQVGALAVAAVAYVAVADPDRSGALPLCPFKITTGWDCPFCGSLRAVHALASAEPAAAVDHNLLFVLVAPVAAVAWLTWLGWSLGWPVRRRHPGRRGWWAIALAAAGFAIARNVATGPLRWLASG